MKVAGSLLVIIGIFGYLFSMVGCGMSTGGCGPWYSLLPAILIGLGVIAFILPVGKRTKINDPESK